MAFLRRGNVRVPHTSAEYILFHRCDGIPFQRKVGEINCWEEHQHKQLTPITIIYWGVASSTAVRESFDEIEAMVNGKAVTS